MNILDQARLTVATQLLSRKEYQLQTLRVALCISVCVAIYLYIQLWKGTNNA